MKAKMINDFIYEMFIVISELGVFNHDKIIGGLNSDMPLRIY